MDYQRREYLRLSGIVGIAALAGCSDDGATEPSPTGQQTQGTPTPEETSTPEETPVPTDAGTTKLRPADTEASRNFGKGVALTDSGTTAMVGDAACTDAEGNLTGSAHEFGLEDASWSERTRFIPADADDQDQFGTAVSVSDDGTTALVGAVYDEVSSGARAGSAYVIDTSGDEWSLLAKLTPDDDVEDNEFGYAVALSGDGTTALVGNPHDSGPGAGYAGSVSVFTDDDGNWTRKMKLTPETDYDNAQFGSSVTLARDGTTALVGAEFYRDANDDSTGAAYVFGTDGDDWEQRAKLTPEDGIDSGNFGCGTALTADGQKAVVGASGASTVSVFEPDGQTWSQTDELTATDGDGGDGFGRSVAVSSDGSTALIGASLDDTNGVWSGSAYVFTADDGSYSQKRKFAPEDVSESAGLGGSVALSGDARVALVGNSDGNDAYVFYP